MMLVFLLNFLILILLVLIGVAYLTLLERKLLSYLNVRKGPNKISLMGIFQPFSDAMKLMSKEMSLLFINEFMFLISPLLMFFLSILLWLLYPWIIHCLGFSMVFFILILGLNVYPIMLIGWISNNNYSMLGSLRSIAQMVSFEISLFLMIFVIMLMIESYSFKEIFKFQINVKFVFLLTPVYLMFMVSMLIELNRTPFDLIEGESELISGFNIEFNSSMFVLIFLAEYSGIMFMSMILTMMFYGFKFWSLKFILTFMIQLMLILWIRGILPRVRYDELMLMCWTDFLICSLFYLFYIYLIKELFVYIKS